MEPDPRSPWTPAYSLAAYVLVLALVVFVRLMSGLAPVIPDTWPVRAFGLGGAQLIALAVVWRFSRERRVRFADAAGLWSFRPLALLEAAAVAGVTLAVAIALGATGSDPVLSYGPGAAGFMTGLAFVVLLAPFAEECLMRGSVLAGLLVRLSPLLAVLLSAALFAVLHMDVRRLLPTLAVGLGAGLLYVRHRSAWPAVASHALHNLVLLVLAYVAPGWPR